MDDPIKDKHQNEDDEHAPSENQDENMDDTIKDMYAEEKRRIFIMPNINEGTMMPKMGG